MANNKQATPTKVESPGEDARRRRPKAGSYQASAGPHSSAASEDWTAGVKSIWPGAGLSQRALEGLATYKYKSGGLTWLDHLHAPAWNAFVELLPMWLAPNLITLVGTMWVVAAWLLSVVYSPTYADGLPPWLCAFAAVSVFIYVNLDCIDGKQARRTGSSSPLGQLFDHGCDAVSLHLLLDTVRASMGLKSTVQAVIVELGIMTPWMLAHWEEYHTGMMLYGNGFFGVLEGNYAIIGIHLVSALAGSGVWASRIPLPFTLPPALQPYDDLGSVMLAGVIVMVIMCGTGQLYRVLIFSPSTLSTQEAGHKQLGSGAAFLHLSTLTLLMGLGLVYLTTSPVLPLARTQAAASALALLKDLSGGGAAGITSLRALLTTLGSLGWYGCIALHARLVPATYGLVYALVATQLVLAHVCKEPFAPFAWTLAVLALGCANNALLLAPPVLVDTALLAVSCLGYWQFVVTTIRQICAFLGIACLKIVKPAKTN